MALHHRQQLSNMRHAYDATNKSRHSDESDSGRSYGSSSAQSYMTQPTEYSSSPANRPSHVHYNSCDSRSATQPPLRFFDELEPSASPRASVDTYASTVHDEEEELEPELPEYDPPEYDTRPSESNVLAATPADFSELFPSRRRLQIHHDDTTLDGNMNLRIDTQVYSNDRKCDVTLFHLRMHDLKNREFSLRRYCRDSGREVCHSERKQQKPQKPAVSTRPGFHRSLSNALNSMRPKSESKTSTLESLRRHDSGYDSMHSVDFDQNERPRSAGQGSSVQSPPSSDTVRLEFSNYAQADVKRTGGKGSKRYEFEYWGITYAWRRIVRKDRGLKEVTYHLTKGGSDQVLAYIVPLSLTRARVDEEHSKGGWVTPCTMWLADEGLIRGQKDAVDVVISSGLIALVDDAIRVHFQSKTSKHLLIPKTQLGVEYVGPKRLINEMFRRDSDSGQQSRPSSSHRPAAISRSATGGSRPQTATVRQSSY